MSSFATQWSISREHDVAADDLDANGSIRDTTLTGWIRDARDAYLAQCTVLQKTCERAGLRIADRSGPPPSGAALGSASAVVVTASATEVLPTSFVIAVRIRPGGGDRDDPVNARCSVTIEDRDGVAHSIDDDIRDELISLEHAARYFN